MFETYQNQGKYKDAVKFLKYKYTLKDSIFKLKNIDNINKLEIKYETRQKESDIKLLKLKTVNQNKQITIQFLVILFLVLGSVSFIVIYSQYKKRN